LNANVARLAAALEKEVVFHAGIEIEMARVSLSSELIKLKNSTLFGSKPTPAELADSTKAPHSTIAADSVAAKARVAALREGDLPEVAVVENLVGTFPYVADIALENPGFTPTRVTTDCFALADVNSAISNETDADLRLVLYKKRNRILDAYLPVATEIEASESYREALNEFLGVVSEQGHIAASHANSIGAFANAQLRLDSITSLVQDHELRESVLGIVADKKGQAYADRVKGGLAKADNVLVAINGLRN
jgi:hypothetical protein